MLFSFQESFPVPTAIVYLEFGHFFLEFSPRNDGITQLQALKHSYWNAHIGKYNNNGNMETMYGLICSIGEF